MNILLGQVCLDIYKNSRLVVPGGGILHNAYHLRKFGCEPILITRIGKKNPTAFLDFFRKNNINVLRRCLLKNGYSSSIDIHIDEKTGEARVSNLFKGVWKNFKLEDQEIDIVKSADNFHIVLVEEVLKEFIRLGKSGIFSKLFVTADLFDLRYISLKDLSKYLKYIDIAFIGWAGNLDDKEVKEVEKIAIGMNKTIVMTFGDKGIIVINPKSKDSKIKFYEVEKVKVEGSTNGCGDAFISYFLAEYWRSNNIDKAIEKGKVGGKKVTEWRFALPDDAYVNV